MEIDKHVSLPGGTEIELDEYGHLLDGKQWSSDVANLLAGLDGMELTDAHWKVIRILRDYYHEFGIEAPMRAIVKQLREQDAEEFASSRALYRLFPEGPVRQGSRYAGLPIPVSCI
jgi:tRNA 2-thiouridine synthesizing protein E